MRTLIKNATPGRVLLATLVWLGALFVLVTPSQAEQLPIKSYTTADGLARDSVVHIIQDSRGFLWFATAEGLSRFDGYRFKNYGVEQGLPHRSVTDLLESRSGVYWIATGDGICRFNPNGTARSSSTAAGHFPAPSTGVNAEPMFVVYHAGGPPRAEIVNTLLEDHTGVIWYGTDEGLYRLEQNGNTLKPQVVEIGLLRETLDDTRINSLVEDLQGSLWVGTVNGLYRRRPDGAVERYTTQQGLLSDNVHSLLRDRNGQLWAGTTFGLMALVDKPELGRTIVAHGYPGTEVMTLFESSNGKLQVGSTGLCELDLNAPVASRSIHCYAKATGLNDRIMSLAEDRTGNL